MPERGKFAKGRLVKSRCLICLGVLLSASAAHADKTAPGDIQEVAPEGWAFKITPSYYMTAHEREATDINIRANQGSHALWVGYYRRGNEFEQTRTGYEYTALLPWGQLIPSLQLATHGFLGGSVNAQIGGDIYGILGFGWTNTRDYYNLNFDPNDSVVYGIGIRLLPRSNLSLFTVKDDRLKTGQRVTHWVWRFLPDDHQRWTVDLSSKHGQPSADADSVSGLGFSTTYDYRSLFVRLARERKVNFSNDDQTRLSIGVRF